MEYSIEKPKSKDKNVLMESVAARQMEMHLKILLAPYFPVERIDLLAKTYSDPKKTIEVIDKLKDKNNRLLENIEQFLGALQKTAKKEMEENSDGQMVEVEKMYWKFESPTNKEIMLREHQKKALEKIKDFLDFNKNKASYCRGYISHPTGTGKTGLFCATIAAAKPKKTLVIVPKIVIGKQTITNDFALKDFVDHPTDNISYKFTRQRNLTIGDRQVKYGTQGKVVVMVADSLRDLVKNNNVNPDEYDLIICDEAHNYINESSIDALNKFNAVKIGFTATPEYIYSEKKKESEEEDSINNHTEESLYCTKKVSDHFAHEIDKLDFGDCIENKLLCPAEYFALKVDIKFDEVKMGDLTIKEKQWKKLNAKALQCFTKTLPIMLDDKPLYLKERKAVAICSSVAQAKDLKKLLNNNGIVSECITGSTSDEQREKYLQDFKDGKINVLTSVFVLAEGWDCPGADTCLMLRPTTSHVLYKQAVGRVLRLDPKNPKKRAVIIDFHGICDALNVTQLDAIKTMGDKLSGGKSKVRPMNEREIKDSDFDVIDCDISIGEKKIFDKKNKEEIVIKDKLVISGGRLFVKESILLDLFPFKDKNYALKYFRRTKEKKVFGKREYVDFQTLMESYKEELKKVSYEEKVNITELSGDFDIKPSQVKEIANKFDVKEHYSMKYGNVLYFYDGNSTKNDILQKIDNAIKNINECLNSENILNTCPLCKAKFTDQQCTNSDKHKEIIPIDISLPDNFLIHETRNKKSGKVITKCFLDNKYVINMKIDRDGILELKTLFDDLLNKKNKFDSMIYQKNYATYTGEFTDKWNLFIKQKDIINNFNKLNLDRDEILLKQIYASDNPEYRKLFIEWFSNKEFSFTRIKKIINWSDRYDKEILELVKNDKGWLERVENLKSLIKFKDLVVTSLNSGTLEKRTKMIEEFWKENKEFVFSILDDLNNDTLDHLVNNDDDEFVDYIINKLGHEKFIRLLIKKNIPLNIHNWMEIDVKQKNNKDIYHLKCDFDPNCYVYLHNFSRRDEENTSIKFELNRNRDGEEFIVGKAIQKKIIINDKREFFTKNKPGDKNDNKSSISDAKKPIESNDETKLIEALLTGKSEEEKITIFKKIISLPAQRQTAISLLKTSNSDLVEKIVNDELSGQMLILSMNEDDFIDLLIEKKIILDWKKWWNVSKSTKKDNFGGKRNVYHLKNMYKNNYYINIPNYLYFKDKNNELQLKENTCIRFEYKITKDNQKFVQAYLETKKK